MTDPRPDGTRAHGHPTPGRDTPAAGGGHPRDRDRGKGTIRRIHEHRAATLRRAVPGIGRTLALPGLGLLILAAVIATLHVVSVHPLSGSGTDLTAGTTVTILANDDVLASDDCTFSDVAGDDMSDRFTAVTVTLSGDPAVPVVSLPFTRTLGVWGTVTVTDDIDGALLTCARGQAWMSAYTPLTLTIMRWAVMGGTVIGGALIVLGALAGLAARAAVTRRRSSGS
ncbi:hypothetical protein [Corynebacterium bovis]|uniref:hypothetical protein n=1 Tax=Corynebacterium bovis TaxID=36808 RepID=UPI00163A1CEF|nr:hypothetical protein [Corynebacterium bovis]